MERFEPLGALGVALAAGLLIGLEREQAAGRDEHRPFPGGVRTHPLVALCAALGSLLLPTVGAWLLAALFLALVVLLAVGYLDDVRRGRDRGLTSEVAFLLTFLLGALAGSRGVIEPAGHEAIVVLGVAVVGTLLLSAKVPLHAIAGKLSREDVLATLKFLIVAVVVLPLLPDATYGPLEVLNPFEIGLMIVLIAGLGFVGYAAIRLLGPGRGLGVTGLLGGLVSSTAVTLSMSGRAKAHPELAPSCALAVVLASTIMNVRVAVETAIVHPPLLSMLALPLGAMLVAGLVACAVLWRDHRRAAARTDGEGPTFANPFELSSAVKFGLLYAAILFASKAASTYLGSGGSYLAGVVGGLTDVDAITLSMASLAQQGLPGEVAVTTILLGVFANTLVKGGMALAVGGRSFGKLILAAQAGVLAAGGLALAALWLG